MAGCQIPAVPVVHPALRRRFSPVGFDPEAELTDGEVDVLLDAARLAPSAGNAQPWSFILARRGDTAHARITPHLARSVSGWANLASLLVVNLCHTGVEGAPGWEYSEFAAYDLGQAVAHMTIQGLSMGLDAHQFRAFDADAIAAEFSVPPHWQVASMTAFGTATHAAGEVSAPGVSRERAALDEIAWARGSAFGCGIRPGSGR